MTMMNLPTAEELTAGNVQSTTSTAAETIAKANANPVIDLCEGTDGTESKTVQLRKIHLQIDIPKHGNKTRAQCVKEALMLVFTTSRHISLVPIKDGEGEIIRNIDDFMTSEQFSSKYLFDARMAGTRKFKKLGSVDMYSTKVRLQTDLTLSQMKWQTNPQFFDALKHQHIYLKEHRDGPPVRTANIGWFTGLNPNQVSINYITTQLDTILETIGVEPIVETHTVSIRFAEQNKSFVTKVLKVRGESEYADAAYKLINKALQEQTLLHGWEGVEIHKFGGAITTTAMLAELQNSVLHEAAIISVKNVWSVNESFKLTSAQATECKYSADILKHNNEVETNLEELLWNVYSGYGFKLQGLVVRRGVMQLLTNREHLNHLYTFTQQFLPKVSDLLGANNFAKYAASLSPSSRQPTLMANPNILTGKGKFEIDTSKFSEDDFVKFTTKHGIVFPGASTKKKFKADLSRPPTALYHSPGREPIERDPSKLSENAVDIWKKFTKEIVPPRAPKQISTPSREPTNAPTSIPVVSPTPTQRSTTPIPETPSKMSTLEEEMNKLRASQNNLEETTTSLRKLFAETNEKMETTNKKIDDWMEKMNTHIKELIAAQIKTDTKVQMLTTTLVNNPNTEMVPTQQASRPISQTHQSEQQFQGTTVAYASHVQATYGNMEIDTMGTRKHTLESEPHTPDTRINSHLDNGSRQRGSNPEGSQ